MVSANGNYDELTGADLDDARYDVREQMEYRDADCNRRRASMGFPSTPSSTSTPTRRLSAAGSSRPGRLDAARLRKVPHRSRCPRRSFGSGRAATQTRPFGATRAHRCAVLVEAFRVGLTGTTTAIPTYVGSAHVQVAIHSIVDGFITFSPITHAGYDLFACARPIAELAAATVGVCRAIGVASSRCEPERQPSAEEKGASSGLAYYQLKVHGSLETSLGTFRGVATTRSTRRKPTRLTSPTVAENTAHAVAVGIVSGARLAWSRLRGAAQERSA